jgi:hypothetical protein
VGREKFEKSKFRSEIRGKGSIKGEVIRDQHPVGPQADWEFGQGGKALETFTYAPSIVEVYETVLLINYTFIYIQIHNIFKNRLHFSRK